MQNVNKLRSNVQLFELRFESGNSADWVRKRGASKSTWNGESKDFAFGDVTTRKQYPGLDEEEMHWD